MSNRANPAPLWLADGAHQGPSTQAGGADEQGGRLEAEWMMAEQAKVQIARSSGDRLVESVWKGQG
ncbi:hypothetical protein H2202_002511 [Exophiala xenobiotica]|nr:hypothetical protein H2202_002511 [Exophiala xenobiotica]